MSYLQSLILSRPSDIINNIKYGLPRPPRAVSHKSFQLSAVSDQQKQKSEVRIKADLTPSIPNPSIPVFLCALCLFFNRDCHDRRGLSRNDYVLSVPRNSKHETVFYSGTLELCRFSTLLLWDFVTLPLRSFLQSLNPQDRPSASPPAFSNG